MGTTMETEPGAGAAPPAAGSRRALRELLTEALARVELIRRRAERGEQRADLDARDAAAAEAAIQAAAAALDAADAAEGAPDPG
jgi:hypothetical protein